MTAFVPFARYYNPTAIISVVGQIVTFADTKGLNFGVTVARSLEAEPDTCEFWIEGLDKFRASAMGAVWRTVPKGQVVTVRAGYELATAGLFTGTLREFSPNSRRGPALVSMGAADDGGDLYSDAIVPMPSTLGLTAAESVATAATAMGLALGDSVGKVIAGATPVKQGPFTAAGVRRASDLLDDACRRLRARWWIRDMQLHMSRRGIPDATRPAIVIAPPAVGPVRFPGVPVIRELTEDGSGLASFVSFFDPNIVPGGQVAYGPRVLRCERVVHSIRTRGGSPWSSAVTGRSL